MGLGGGKGEVGGNPTADRKSSSSSAPSGRAGNERSAYDSSPSSSSSRSTSSASSASSGGGKSGYSSSGGYNSGGGGTSGGGGMGGSSSSPGKTTSGATASKSGTERNGSVFSANPMSGSAIQSRVNQGFDAVSQDSIKSRVSTAFDSLSRYDDPNSVAAQSKTKGISQTSPGAYSSPSSATVNRAVRADPMSAPTKTAAISTPGSAATGRAVDRETMPGYSTAPVARSPLTGKDRDSMIRTVYGEAGNQGNLGKSAVASAVLNRVASPDFPDSVDKVVKQKNQFEPWNTASGRARMNNIPQSEYERIGRIVDETVSGVLPDVTGGAQYFANEGVVRSRNAGKVTGWMGKMADSAVNIGDHTFYGGDKTKSPMSTAFAGDTQKSGGLLAAADMPTPQANPRRQERAASADPFTGLTGGLSLNSQAKAAGSATAFADQKTSSFAEKYLSGKADTPDEAKQDESSRRVSTGFGDLLGGATSPDLQGALNTRAAQRSPSSISLSAPAATAQRAPDFSSPPREVSSAPVASVPENNAGRAPAFTSPPREVASLPVADVGSKIASGSDEKAPSLNWGRAVTGASIGSAFGGLPGAVAGGLIGATSEYITSGDFGSKYLGMNAGYTPKYDPAGKGGSSSGQKSDEAKVTKSTDSPEVESPGNIFIPTQTTGGLAPSKRFARSFYEEN